MNEEIVLEEKQKSLKLPNPIIKIRNISKAFSNVEVLKDLNLEVFEGEIHAIVGENGAGKSTLMKIISGEYHPTSGNLIVSGKERRFYSPSEAFREGIVIIHQEFSLVPQLTAYENVFLGRWGNHTLSIVNKNKLKAETNKIFRKLGIDHISTNTKVSNLSIGDKQLVEIAKALSVSPKILIMDEPTAALSLDETKSLFEVLRNLKKQGVTILFISHRLEEIFEIADRVTVLRNGELVSTSSVSDTTMDELVAMMVGRELENRFPEKPSIELGKTILKVENITSEPFFRNISFEVKKGEILGIAGLVGCGSTQLGEALFGLKKVEGNVLFEGEKLRIKKPVHAIRNGILFVPGDRHTIGLILKRSVRENHALPNFDMFSSFGFMNLKKEKESTLSIAKKLNTKITGISQKIENLSGGNQQKVVFGKWLVRSPKLLILDEPTRGIDVGTKYEIYKLIYELASKGVAIIIISSEMDEVMNLSDKILVMSEGRITGELSPQDATQEKILLLAVQGKEKSENE